MSAESYQSPDDVKVTSCRKCPWTDAGGWYVWCPNCGSQEVVFS